MDAAEKVRAAVAEVRATRRGFGMHPAPAFYRLLWWLGLRLTPPHFQSFWGIAVMSGIPFGILLSAFNVVVLGWSHWWVALGAAALYGIGMASLYRSEAVSRSLPAWRDYEPGSLTASR